MQRSVQYNNAGVACIEAGHHRVAWELFKGALEVKLAVERHLPPSESQAQEDASSVASVVDNGNTYIQKAETHLMNLTSYMSVPPASVPSAPTYCAMEDSSSQENSSSPALPLSPLVLDPRSRQSPLKADILEDLYSPFLFRTPMRLPLDADMTTRRESATIIFNLALVDHMKNRCSEQAVQLYELAMTLLTGDVVDRLGIALMNNIGVWCYENGDMDGTIACMGHLSSFLGSCGAAVDQEQKEGLQSNILWLTNPPFAASPAA